MAMPTHEIHPMLVHFPLALLPTAIGTDAVGTLTDNQALLDTGKTLMPLVVASMAANGVAGFAAQEEVRAAGGAYDMLLTHRSLNVSLSRSCPRSRGHAGGAMRPGPGYLLAGLAGAALMNHSGYLGGKMV